MNRPATLIFGCLWISGSALAGAISNFNVNAESWDSVRFLDVSGVPNFGSLQGTNAVTYNSTGGNPGGYISMQDPDANWQYFRAPSAFLGNQSGALGGSLTFDLRRFDTFSTGALSPAGPLVGVTDGTTVLVNTTMFANPVTSDWTSYSVLLSTTGGLWRVSNASGAVATSGQLSTVFSNLSGLYILADYFNGAGANGEIIGLDNVNLPGSVPEPSSALMLGGGLLVAYLARRKLSRSVPETPSRGL